MKKQFFIAAAILAGASLNPAIAGENYLGVDFMKISYETTGGYEASPTALRGKLGTYLSPNVALEGGIGFGLASGGMKVGSTLLDLEIDNFIGLYVRGEAPLNEKFKVNGMIGFTSGKATASAVNSNYSESDSESDLSYGVGCDISMSETSSFTIEYAQLIDKPEFSISSLNFGVKIEY